MLDNNDCSPFFDLNEFHEVNQWVDSRIFSQPIDHYSGNGQAIPPLSDVIDNGCAAYEISQPHIREAALGAVAAQFGMRREALDQLIAVWGDEASGVQVNLRLRSLALGRGR